MVGSGVEFPTAVVFTAKRLLANMCDSPHSVLLPLNNDLMGQSID